jgi:L-threonylcarbamoyladenylate synthase
MSSDSPISTAVAALKRGEVIALATDTVYGLVCDPQSTEAVKHLFDLKGRSERKPLQLLAQSAEQARSLIEIPAQAESLTAHWPGALTLIGVAKKKFAAGVGTSVDGKTTTLGVRVPSNAIAQSLLAAFGSPLAATSANHSGHPDATTAVQVQQAFQKDIAVIVEADSEVISNAPSTVVDITGPRAVVLRRGALVLKP